MESITAIILAAGQGTRLRPLTNNIPKCMVEVGGMPLLTRQVNTLTDAGIKNIIVVAGYKEEIITDSRVVKIINPRFDETNMIYSLFCAERQLKGQVLICYGDIIYSKGVLEKMLRSEGDIVVASDKAWKSYWEERCEDVLSDAETFVKGEANKVKTLGQKAKSAYEIEGQFIGLIKLTSNGLETFKENYHACRTDLACKQNAWGSGKALDNAFMTDFLNYLAGKDQLSFAEINRGWFEVDNFNDLELANKNIAQAIID